MKKKKEEFKFTEIDSFNSGYETAEIPEGATHVEAEIDYSRCWYESDMPTIKLKFYKKEKV